LFKVDYWDGFRVQVCEVVGRSNLIILKTRMVKKYILTLF